MEWELSFPLKGNSFPRNLINQGKLTISAEKRMKVNIIPCIDRLCQGLSVIFLKANLR
jgi:hypothetical protein